MKSSLKLVVPLVLGLGTALAAQLTPMSRGQLVLVLGVVIFTAAVAVASVYGLVARRLSRELTRLAAALKETQRSLLRQQRERARAVEELRHADRLSTIGKIASGVAHEMGTPLNVITGRAELIGRDQASPPEVVESAEIIRGQAERLAGTIRQLLGYARRNQPQPEAQALAEILARASRLLGPMAEDAGVVIDTRAPADLEASFDGAKVLQLLTNLMVNAIQAMPCGGRLEVQASHEQVEQPGAGHAAPGDYVRITVADTGVGMTDDQLRHAFEPFFTSKPPGSGTGLGLSVCRDIVDEHGGWIGVQSAPLQGTRFSVYLPARAA